MANRWENNGNRDRFFFLGGGASKSLQMVTSATKLKDAYSMEGKLWPTWTAYQKAETSFCHQRSISSRLWFFQWSCMDVSSVQFSHSVVSDSLWPHELQHTRPPCPSPTPGVHPNSCPLSQWCHPTISSSVIRFSSCPQSFPASGSFPMSQLFISCCQSIGVSASTSVLPMDVRVEP